MFSFPARTVWPTPSLSTNAANPGKTIVGGLNFSLKVFRYFPGKINFTETTQDIEKLSRWSIIASYNKFYNVYFCSVWKHAKTCQGDGGFYGFLQSIVLLKKLCSYLLVKNSCPFITKFQFHCGNRFQTEVIKVTCLF